MPDDGVLAVESLARRIAVARARCDRAWWDRTESRPIARRCRSRRQLEAKHGCVAHAVV